MKVCTKVCNECPFSNKSLRGFLAGYSVQDFMDFMSNDALFPCHKLVKKGAPLIEITNSIRAGELAVCRGYTESIIKSCKSPRDSEFRELITRVKEHGISKDSMSIYEFATHHKPFVS